MELFAVDQAELIVDKKPRYTADGYLLSTALVARTGIQEYLGSELGMDQEIVRVYRPESTVFAKDSLASYAHKPITNDHPPVAVDASNYTQYAKGHMGEEVARDGEHVRVPLMLADQSVIDDVVSGKKVEVSAGYKVRLEVEAGVTDSGEEYDAIQRDIRINHLAIVRRGRAGTARISDSWADFSSTKPKSKSKAAGRTSKPKGKKAMDVRTVIVDGLSVETTDAGAQAIEKLKGDLKSANQKTEDNQTQHDTALKSLKDSHADAIKAKDEEIGKLRGEKKALEDAAMTPEKLDVLVADRAKLIGKAMQIMPDANFDGKTDDAIRRECVEKHYGDGVDANDSADVILGMFKGIKVSDKVTRALQSPSINKTSNLSDSQALYEESISRGISVQQLMAERQKAAH